MKDFFELTDQELLALGIPLEEDDSGAYRGFAEDLKRFLQRKSVWLRRPLGLGKVRAQGRVDGGRFRALLRI